MIVTASQQVALRAGFLVLIGFAILRPLSLIASNAGLAGLNVLEFFAIGVSYLLLIPVIVGLRQLRVNRITLFLLLFCLYCTASLCWGSEVRKVIQVTLPFLLFFSVRMFITHSSQMSALSIALVLGFLIPICLSTYYVATGQSIEMTEYWNKLPRFQGAFSGSHTLAYAMLFFSFLYSIFHHAYQVKNTISRFVIYSFLILSVYCLYQSHTRTALIGFVVFWFMYLWGKNRKSFYAAIVACAVISMIFYGHISSLIWKKNEPDINTATSGRITIWQDNIELFSDSSIPQQLLGKGLGHEHRVAFHNDYLALLMSLGVVGLFLYLVLLFYLLWDIFLCKDKKTKYLFGGVLASVVIMNFGSNAVVFRTELSQYFWLIMGLFYCIPEFRNAEYGAKRNYPGNY